MKYKVKFTGSFLPFFGYTFLGGLLAVVTLGLLLPIIAYFQMKYIVENIEISE